MSPETDEVLTSVLEGRLIRVEEGGSMLLAKILSVAKRDGAGQFSLMVFYERLEGGNQGGLGWLDFDTLKFVVGS